MYLKRERERGGKEEEEEEEEEEEKKKKCWVHPITSQRLLKGKFYSLYKDLKAHPQVFFRYFRMSSATFH